MTNKKSIRSERNLDTLIEELNSVPAERWRFKETSINELGRWGYVAPHTADRYTTRIKRVKIDVERWVYSHTSDSDENYGEETEYKYNIRINDTKVYGCLDGWLDGHGAECRRLGDTFHLIESKVNQADPEKRADRFAKGLMDGLGMWLGHAPTLK